MALAWQKSSFSGGGTSGECVEVAAAPDGLLRLREGDRPAAVVTTVRAQWDVFVKGIKAGEFDL
jgi:predicted secreted Zn-dependent protease